MAESKQISLSEPEPETQQNSGKDSPCVEPVASPMDTTEDTGDKGRDKCSPSPTAQVPSEEAVVENVESEKVTHKEKEVATDENDLAANSEPVEEVPVVEAEEVKTASDDDPVPLESEGSSVPAPKKEVPMEEEVFEKEEEKTKEALTPVAVKVQQNDDGDDGGGDDVLNDDAESAVNGEPKESTAGAAVVVALAGESRKRSQDHSRRSRSSSGSSTSSSSNGNSISGEPISSSSSGASSNSNSDSEGVSSAKKVKLEPVLEQPLQKEPKTVETEPNMVEEKGSDSKKKNTECSEDTEVDKAGDTKLTLEEKPMEAEMVEMEQEDDAGTPQSASQAEAAAATSPAEQVDACKSPSSQGVLIGVEPGEEESRTETLLPPPPPPPPPASTVSRAVPEVTRTTGKTSSIVAPVLERPDSARLTADLQSCQRQLAEVRSKYDVTRKELHATKRKLKRMSVRLGNMTGGGGGSAASGGIVGGSSPHTLTVGPGMADDDRNRKWREPMIVAAMKIKNAMGIQAYKSLIKDGELLLPSLRTITRYLESLRKAGGGAAAAAAALANASVGLHSASKVDEVPEEEEDDDEEEGDDVLAVRTDGVVHRRMEQPGTKKKHTKANGAGAGRTIDHNRNEQRRHPSYSAQHQRHQGPDVQDIKTEQDPVSFTEHDLRKARHYNTVGGDGGYILDENWSITGRKGACLLGLVLEKEFNRMWDPVWGEHRLLLRSASGWSAYKQDAHSVSTFPLSYGAADGYT
uniref:Uncharacterized protein n=1 Tax=Anopheles christyi TaxID=43041 RepID=A0A182JWE1_9DIPT